MVSFQIWSMETIDYIWPVNSYWLGPEIQEDNIIIVSVIKDTQIFSFIPDSL